MYSCVCGASFLHGWLTLKASAFLQTFEQYPPSQEPHSFTIKYIEEEVEGKIQEAFKQPGNK